MRVNRALARAALSVAAVLARLARELLEPAVDSDYDAEASRELDRAIAADEALREGR